MNGENLEYNCFSDIMKAIKSPDSANLSSSMISEVIQIVFWFTSTPQQVLLSNVRFQQQGE